jgi:hypothetical protein
MTSSIPASSLHLLDYGATRIVYGATRTGVGEHHAVLRCGVPASAFFAAANGRWRSQDERLALVLDEAEHVLGLRAPDFDSLLQLRPIGGRTHVAMTSVRPAISRFLHIVSVVRAILEGASFGLPLSEPIATEHGAAAVRMLRGELERDAELVKQEGELVGELVGELRDRLARSVPRLRLDAKQDRS